MEPTNIVTTPKMWYPGDARVEPFMVPVNDELHRHNLPRDVRVSVYNRAYEAVEAAINKYAITREEIEAPLRAEIERLKADRAELQTYIEEIIKLEASLGTAFSWADLREFKEATRKIARAALALPAPKERTVKDSLTVGEERGPEVGE